MGYSMLQRTTTPVDFLSAVEEHGCIAAAVSETDWTYHHYSRLRKSDPDFAEQIDDVLESCVKRVEDALYCNALSGNTTAQIFYLVNRAPDKWKHINRDYHQDSVGPVKIVRRGNTLPVRARGDNGQDSARGDNGTGKITMSAIA